MKLTKSSILMLAAGLLTLGLSLARADDFTVSSQLNNLAIASTLISEDPRYRDALLKAQEAFFKQIGFSQNLDKFSVMIAEGAKNKTASAIDNHTPLSSKHVFFSAAIAYSVLVKKQVSQRFRDPFNKDIIHIVTATKDSYATSIQIPF